MFKMLELVLADGKELDIPATGIIVVEEMDDKTNENFPTAKSFLAYTMGEDVRIAICSTKIEDISFELDVSVDPSWLTLTKKQDGLKLILRSQSIIARESLEDGCSITYYVGKEVKTMAVNESRRAIKKWTDRTE